MLFLNLWPGRGSEQQALPPISLAWESPIPHLSDILTYSLRVPLQCQAMLGCDKNTVSTIVRKSRNCKRGGERGSGVVGRTETADFATLFGEEESKLGES